MANVFDQFDAAPAPAMQSKAAPAGNVFDQFDAAPAQHVDDPSKVSVGSVTSNALTTANRNIGNLGNAVMGGVKVLTGQRLDTPMVDGTDLHDEYNKRFAPQVEQNGPLDRVGAATGQMMADNIAPMVMGAGLLKTGVNAVKPAWELAQSTIGQKLGTIAEDLFASQAAKPIASTIGAAEVGAGGGAGKEIAKTSGINEHAGETAGQFALPALVDGYSKIAPVALTMKALPTIAGKLAQMLPESMLPSALRTAEGTTASRAADKLGFANREGKYADPNVEAPAEPNWLTRQQDAGAQARTDKALSSVGKDISTTLQDPKNAAALNESEGLQTQIPGFKPGLARSTNDPALLNLQERLDSQASGNELRGAQGAYDASKEAVQTKAKNIAPAAGEYPEDTVAATGRARVDNINDRIDAQRTRTQGELQRQSDSLPTADPSASGTYLRDTRKALQDEANTKTNDLRNAIDPGNTSKVVVGKNEDGSDITASVNDILEQRSKALQEIRNISSARGSTPADIARREQLQDQVDKLNKFTDNLQLPDKDMQGRFDAFRTYYRDEYVPRFSEGASRDIGKYDQFGYGKNSVDAEDVPGQFFKPNNISEARQFNKLYGDDPKARQTMTDTALDDLRRTGVDPNTGLLKDGAVNKWLAKNERVLNEMPWVREAVSAKNPDALYQRLGQLEQRQRTVADSNLSKQLGKNPENQLSAAMNDWQVMKDLKSTVRKDPAADAALTRAVMNRAPDPFDGNKLSAWLESNKRSLSQVLTPQHIADLNAVMKAAEIQGRAARPTGVAESPASTFDVMQKTTGTSLPTALSTVTALERGRSSKPYEIGRVVLNWMHKSSAAEANGLWKEALSNPAVAKQLAAAAKAGTATNVQKDRLTQIAKTLFPEDTTAVGNLGRTIPQAIQQGKEATGGD